MHKYSYLLSDSYRREPSNSHHIVPKSNSKGMHQHSFRAPQDQCMSHLELSKTVIAKSNATPYLFDYKVSSNQKQPKLNLHQPSSAISTLENQLKILNTLGERHSQALKELNRQPKLQGSGNVNRFSPQVAPQNECTRFNNTLKREFSFNNIPQPNAEPRTVDVDCAKTEQNWHFDQSFTRKTSFSNKLSRMQEDDHRMRVKQKAELHLTMAHLNHPTEDSYSKQRTRSSTQKPVKHECESTLAKLSSLQQRIKSTIQPHLHI